MMEIFVALGAFLLGVGATSLVWLHALHIGFELGRDDRALDPGESTGLLPTPAVGEASGRHAKLDWPADDDTTVIPVVTDA